MLEARPPSVSPTLPGAPATTPEGVEQERPDALAAEVAKAVRELRVGLGLSERAAARLLGTSQTQLRRMEDPRYLPSLRSLSRLAAAYGQKLRVAFEARDKPPARAVRPPARQRPTSRDRRGERTAKQPRARKRGA